MARLLPRVKSPKAASAAACERLEQLPNIGPAMATDLELIGIHAPEQLIGRDAFELYRALCERTGVRQDPCVIDVFLSVVDFMGGGEPQPWWAFTRERKRRMAAGAV